MTFVADRLGRASPLPQGVMERERGEADQSQG